MAMDPEMKRMQQEAVRRVQEMHNRAQQRVQENPPEPGPREKPPKPEEGGKPAAPAAHPGKPLPATNRYTYMPATLWDGLMQDSERTLILILLLLLFTEKADTSVLFSPALPDFIIDSQYDKR